MELFVSTVGLVTEQSPPESSLEDGLELVDCLSQALSAFSIAVKQNLIDGQNQELKEVWIHCATRLGELLQHPEIRHNWAESSGAPRRSLPVLVDAAVTASQRLALLLNPGPERGRLGELLMGPISNLSEDEHWLSMEHCHLAIKGWTGCPGGEAQDRRQHWLARMEQLHAQKQRSTAQSQTPLQVTEQWNRLMMAHFEVKNLKRVRELWEAMTMEPSVVPDELSFSVILKALADEGSYNSAMQAHETLKEMLYSPRSYQPQAKHFGSAMVAWSKSRHPDAGKYCSEIFELLQAESQENADVIPNIVHYSALIASWGRQKNDPQTVQRILDLFDAMIRSGIEPDEASYVTVMASLSRTHTTEGAIRAQEMLEQMETQASLRPVPRHCYASAMRAWAEAPSPLAAERCEAILKRLEAAFVNSGRNPELMPHTFAYCALMDAYTRQDQRMAGIRAKEVLDRVEAAAAQGMAEPPDKAMYGYVMSALLTSQPDNVMHEVNGLLQRMKDSYSSGNASAKPDSQIMTFVLRANAKSLDPDKARVAWDILRDMIAAYEGGDVDMRPSKYCFAEVLAACAFTKSRHRSGKAEVLKMALLTMNKLDSGKYDRPTAQTFRLLFEVVGRQIDDRREALRVATVVFQRCCQEGVVNSFVLKAIRKHVPELLSKVPVDANNNLLMPPQWSRNAAY